MKYTNTSIFRNTSFNASVYFQDFYTIYDYREAPRWKTGGQSAILKRNMAFCTDFNTEFRKDGILKASLTYGIDLLNEHTTQPLVDGRVWVPELNMMAFAPLYKVNYIFTEDLTVKWEAAGI